MSRIFDTASAVVASVALFGALLGPPQPAAAGADKTCLTGNIPEVAGDAAAIAQVRDLIDAACDCASYDGSKGKTHSSYVACAKAVIAAEIEAGHLRKYCKQTVSRYYSRSNCGADPLLHKLPCIKTDSKTGKITCTIKAGTKRDGVTPADKCVDKPGKYTQVGCDAAHADWTTCIDAADSNGDLIVGAGPGGSDTGVCACHAGFLDCNADVSDGCEAELASDPQHCGSCANGCSSNNATASCEASTCGISKCSAGFLNSDLDPTTGCETACPNRSALDLCNGADDDCDGVIDNYSGAPAGTTCNFASDVHNCGSAGHDCFAGAVHETWSCVSSTCTFGGCQAGYFDLNGDNHCEYPCVFSSAQEICNGIDDDCDGQIDEGVIAPSPVQVCGVSPAASAAECTSGVSVSCVNGGWQCSFPAGVCNPSCAGATEVCDALDNNCNGALNENVPRYGQPCASDDGQPSDSVCRTTGSYVCNGADAVQCSAVRNLAAAGPELCDGIDNDCDGLVDEPFSNKGTNTTYFVKPAVTKIASNLWIFSEEASRPNASSASSGTGNGYTCAATPCTGGSPAAPAGTPLDKTPACSAAGKLPWFNVTPIEAEQACVARGGHVCTTSEWQTACKTNPPSATTCGWGYAPLGSACTTALGPPYASPFPTTGPKYCNLQPTFDFSSVTAGDQDGLLTTASAQLKNCYADWTALLGNGAGNGKLFDLTGNLREITKAATNTYDLMGGSYLSQVEAGAACGFASFVTDQSFAAQDTGFRCCFSSDPTL